MNCPTVDLCRRFLVAMSCADLVIVAQKMNDW